MTKRVELAFFSACFLELEPSLMDSEDQGQSAAFEIEVSQGTFDEKSTYREREGGKEKAEGEREREQSTHSAT